MIHKKNLFKLGLLIFTALFVFGFSQSTLAATLAISPTSTTVLNGQTFTANIILNTAGANVEGVDIISLHYNPAILQVQDSGAAGGTQIAPGTLLPTTLINTVNANGTIQFSQLNLVEGFYNGSAGVLATITFRAIATGTSAITFDFSPGSTTDTNVSGTNATELLTAVTNASFTVVNASTKFSTGDAVQVQTTTPLNVRATASSTGTILGTQPDGARGVITGGPTYANGFHWWQVNYSTGADGWSAEDFLVDVVADTINPVISLTAPAAGATVTNNVNVTADASDAGGVAGVQFRLDGVALGAEDTTSPYSISWNTTGATNGSHSLTALARDAAGNTTISSSRTVTVSNVVADTTDPVVALTAPASGATIVGNVTVSATASDTGGGVAGVQFKIDSSLLNAEDTTATNGSYSTTLNTTQFSNGTHSLSAEARDVAGNVATSALRTITINNPVTDTTPPVISNINGTATYKISNITWTTNENSDTQVEYGPTTSYGSTTVLAATLTTAHAQFLQNLNPGILYHYRVKSKDAAGNLTTSTDRTIQTQSRLPKPPKPTGTILFTPGSINLGWASLDYELCASIKIYRDTSSAPQTQDSTKLVATLDCSDTSYHDTTVTAGTTYYYSIFVIDDVGVASDPLSGSFTAPGSTPNPPPPAPPSPPPSPTPSGGGGGGGGGGSKPPSSPTPTTVPGCSPGLIFSPTTGKLCPVTSPSPAPSTSIAIGSTVQTTTVLNVRATASSSGALLGAQQRAARGVVTNGPIVANGFTWWQVNYNTGVDGWSVANFLLKVNLITTPTPSPTYTPTPPPSGAGTLIIFTKPTDTLNRTTAMNLQITLNKALGLRLVVDGKYGPGTLAALKAFQAKNGLTADGKIGDMTRAKLNAVMATK